MLTVFLHLFAALYLAMCLALLLALLCRAHIGTRQDGESFPPETAANRGHGAPAWQGPQLRRSAR